MSLFNSQRDIIKHMKTAIIVKGNPKYVGNNLDADRFYNEIKEFIENLDYSVKFDPGEPYTQPEQADLWIGHSRGVDRLRFAPKETLTISLGSDDPNSINHPLDNSVKEFSDKDYVPNKFHYVLSDEMKEEIKNRLS